MGKVKILDVYNWLFSEYGPQGWWPIQGVGQGGYHPGDYSYPKDREQAFEICIGAILTQSVNWNSAAKAIANLKALKALSPTAILEYDEAKIKKAIRPAGYFNQKLIKIKRFSEYFLKLRGSPPKRDELLAIWGIGPETADSILLYAFSKPSFVVDAYTKRLCRALGWRQKDYESIKLRFEGGLPRDFRIYQEFHALIVEHAKRFYNRDSTNSCPLIKYLEMLKSNRSK